MQYKSTKVAMQLGEIFLLLVVLVLVAREGAGASVEPHRTYAILKSRIF